jgi:NodT family efflux transporter outer membrane factor (OMF) lipoprotein
LAIAAAILLAGLGACSLAPRYAPPSYALPAQWRGEANPSDALPRGPWWERFNDPLLNSLEQRLEAQNPNLAAMYEQYVQAREAAAIARAALYPQLAVSGQTALNKESPHALFRSQLVRFGVEGDNLIEGQATWQPDFWQLLKNQERQQARLAQSSAALVANARLSLEVQLADTYFALRGLDALAVIYSRSVAEYQKSVDITQMRLAGKIGSLLDVRRAQALLDSTRALESANLANRSVLEHAIAVLVGENASTFTLPPDRSGRLANPAVPSGVPAALLERRPDIASAERQMAAANAGVGVARAAFFPNITLSATGGFEDTGFHLFDLENSLWSIGASGVQPLFQGGLRRAELQRSWSQFAQTRDNYRATVLAAFQQVEDGLALSQSLVSQVEFQKEAVTAANAAVSLTEQLFIGGVVTYLDVVVAQETALSDAQSEVQTQTLQLTTTANLIGALGGGWTTQDLPGEKAVMPLNPADVLRHDRRPRPDGTGDAGLEASHPPQ